MPWWFSFSLNQIWLIRHRADDQRHNQKWSNGRQIVPYYRVQINLNKLGNVLAMNLSKHTKLMAMIFKQVYREAIVACQQSIMQCCETGFADVCDIRIAPQKTGQVLISWATTRLNKDLIFKPDLALVSINSILYSLAFCSPCSVLTALDQQLDPYQ